MTRLKIERSQLACELCRRRHTGLDAHEHLVSRADALALPPKERDRIMADENILILCPVCHSDQALHDRELTAILVGRYGRERILAWAASLNHTALLEQVRRKLDETERD